MIIKMVYNSDNFADNSEKIYNVNGFDDFIEILKEICQDDFNANIDNETQPIYFAGITFYFSDMLEKADAFIYNECFENYIINTLEEVLGVDDAADWFNTWEGDAFAFNNYNIYY